MVSKDAKIAIGVTVVVLLVVGLSYLAYREYHKKEERNVPEIDRQCPVHGKTN